MTHKTPEGQAAAQEYYEQSQDHTRKVNIGRGDWETSFNWDAIAAAAIEASPELAELRIAAASRDFEYERAEAAEAENERLRQRVAELEQLRAAGRAAHAAYFNGEGSITETMKRLGELVHNTVSGGTV